MQGSHRSWKPWKVKELIISISRPGKSWNLSFQYPGLESHGSYYFNIQAWKVMEFIISISRPGKSRNLSFQYPGLESHGSYYFNIQAWKVMEFIISISRPGKSWKLGEGHGKSWKMICRSENKEANRYKVEKKKDRRV